MAEEPNANAMGNEEEMKNDGMKAVETRRSKRRRREWGGNCRCIAEGGGSKGYYIVP